jgi:hypothetical protein
MQNTAKTESTIRPTPHPGQRCVTVPLLLRSFRTLSGVAVLPAGAGSLPTELLLLSLPSPRPLRPPPQQLLLQPLWSEGILLVAVVAAHHLTAEDLECHLSTPRWPAVPAAVNEAAARGRSALDLRRRPSRGLCLARPL